MPIEPPNLMPLDRARAIFLAVAQQIDGATLVRQALASPSAAAFPAPTAVLAIGKVAFPMFDGAHATQPVRKGLLIAPATRFPAEVHLPEGVRAVVSDHPTPSDRSLAAGHAAHAFVAGLSPADRLLVLLSGGGSALCMAPAEGLTLDDKRAAVTAVARGGAGITELNAVRKHLSAIKGGQLALATPAPTLVLALSDVVGNDPGTIASGPFSPDASTFAQADELVRRFAPAAAPSVRDRLARGLSGQLPETPKPGDPRLRHVEYRVIADPDRVTALARAEVESRGLRAGVLSRNTEESVAALSTAYGERAVNEAGAGGSGRVLIGNGEPSIAVTGNGRGGRATHLALLMARAISGLRGVAFLAAGTDDRDGSSSASGAVVDGATWTRALAQGLDPEAALSACDSERPLAALGCLVNGPGSSNLLDLHLLVIDPAS